VPPYDNVEVGKYTNKIPNPSSQPSSFSHDPNPIDNNLDWFMKPMMNINLSIPPNGINIHNFSLESDFYSYPPLSSLSHDPLPLNLHDQSLPNPSIN